ncbi:MAG TPA: isoleucine--tRNA ligase, partial [Euzebya sp.]|nr:isoleucine--tRNA ligase [Euzebya sp.]
HVEARIFKDVFPRHRTMTGHHVPRKGGWDCHGIPVELEVERQLGFTAKSDIEAYGVEAFNALCRQSVETYVEEWTRLTERIGFWVDTDDAYWTMSTAYIESVWWSLKQLWDADLLYQGHKVVPYCGRCGTSLSDHEVALGYAEVDDPSAYVRLPITEGPLAQQGASLAVWTTTPWTLVANTLVAVGPDIAYVLALAPGDDYPVVIAADLAEPVLGEGTSIVRDVPVTELVGLHYRGPFDFIRPTSGDFRYITSADFVTTAEGTGLVHLAPAFGADDHATALREGVEVMNPVDAEGRFGPEVPPYAGRFVKDTDPDVITDLRSMGLLIRAQTHRHSYPFCWRCASPLLYYATPSWYIATSRHKQDLLAVNAGVDWHPPHIRDGRYGDWLEHNVDWALSRSRYWGTPLPIWRCDTAGVLHDMAVGSLAELGQAAGRDLSDLDPHRPFVDEVRFACPQEDCEGTMQRVGDVIDAWYDSGAMPFAQFGHPHQPGSQEHFEQAFPADYICEAIDQTRGWFYSQMALAVLLFDQTAYRTVLCLGHIVDDEGRKMSKSLGNILSPWEVLDRHGADPLRWLLLTDGSPWLNRRVGHDALEEVVRRFFLTVWNTYYFFTTYARTAGWTPGSSRAPAVADRPVMDRWVLAELAALVATVDGALTAYDATTAGQALERFVDDLSNWYLRRSRARFGTARDDEGDTHAAFATLHECLVTLTALLAPFTPFLAEALYDNLVRSVDAGAPDSVHLLDFPRADPAAHDPDLRGAMATARRVVTLGLRARNDARIGVRQPLPRALVHLPDPAGWDQVAEVVARELNLKALHLSTGGDTVTHRLKPDFRELGRAFGPATPDVAAAITAADAGVHVADLRAGKPVALSLADRSVQVTPAMVQVVEEAREGWQVAAEGGTTIALDLSLDDGLRREGLARELVRTVNDLRKQHGLQLDDRIRLEVAVDGQLRQAVEDHRSAIMRDTLAVAVVQGPAGGPTDGDRTTS